MLAFPQPNIAAAAEQIDQRRRDLLASLTDYVATALRLGNAPAAIISRMTFRYFAPEVKVRLYRRVGAALPPAARGPVHSDRALLLPQHPRLVARERFAGAVIFVPAANKQFDGTLQA